MTGTIGEIVGVREESTGSLGKTSPRRENNMKKQQENNESGSDDWELDPKKACTLEGGDCESCQ